MTKKAPVGGNLSAWLQWLEQLHHKQIDLTLDRIQLVANKLAVTTFSCPVITIGGTNGKGSCVATLEAIYLLGDYQVGAYTSPHLLQFNERIRINGQSVTDQQLLAAFLQVERARGDVSLSFFEFTTLAGLFLFKQANLDVILLEIGLGGRFDAVNIVDANVSIITSIDLDHTDWLGDTREKIAAEKAPIYRPGCFAICGDPDPPVSLIQYAQQIGAHLLCQGKDFYFREQGQYWSWYTAQIQLKHLPLPRLMLQNVSSALMAYCCLVKTLPVARAVVNKAIATTTVMGRFQQLRDKPPVIVDVAHNPAAAQVLVKKLQQYYGDKKIYAVFSALADKDATKMVAALKPLIEKWYIAPLTTARSRTLDNLTEVFSSQAVKEIEKFANISEAYQQAVLHSTAENCIIVFGSFYTVAAVLEAV